VVYATQFQLKGWRTSNSAEIKQLGHASRSKVNKPQNSILTRLTFRTGVLKLGGAKDLQGGREWSCHCVRKIVYRVTNKLSQWVFNLIFLSLVGACRLQDITKIHKTKYLMMYHQQLETYLKDVCSQGEGFFSSAGILRTREGGGFFRCVHAQFLVQKSFEFFDIYGASARTREVNYSRFCANVIYWFGCLLFLLLFTT